jgi:hypothetical protein
MVTTVLLLCQSIFNSCVIFRRYGYRLIIEDLLGPDKWNVYEKNEKDEID